MKVLAELLRSNPALFKVLSEMMPGGHLAAAPEPVESRWHFVLDCLRWLLVDAQRRAMLRQAILQHFGAVKAGKVCADQLPADASFVLYELSSPVCVASLAVALDIGLATTKRELQFLQSSHGLHMAKVFDFFVLTSQRRLAIRNAAQSLAEMATNRQRASAAETAQSYVNNALDPSEVFSSPSSAPAASRLSHLARSTHSDGASSSSQPAATRRSTRAATVSARMATATANGAEESDIKAAQRELNDRDEDAMDTSDPSGERLCTASDAFQVFPPWTRRVVRQPAADDCQPSLLFATVHREAQALEEEDRVRFLALASEFALRFLDASARVRPQMLQPYLTPAHYLASIASPNTGQRTANALMSLGSEKLMQMVCDQTNLSARELQAAISDESYRGPLIILSDPKLCDELQTLANSDRQDALGSDAALSGLLLQWKRNFAAIPISADFAEDTVKALAGLKGQQRSDDRIASRFLRRKINPFRCVLPAEQPMRWDMTDSIWETMLPEKRKRSADAAHERLASSRDNPYDLAVPQMTEQQRSSYNKSLGFNVHYTEEQREKRQQPPAPTSEAELEATQELCAHHFATLSEPPEPELAPDGRPKKRRRKAKPLNGKDAKED